MLVDCFSRRIQQNNIRNKTWSGWFTCERILSQLFMCLNDRRSKCQSAVSLSWVSVSGFEGSDVSPHVCSLQLHVVALGFILTVCFLCFRGSRMCSTESSLQTLNRFRCTTPAPGRSLKVGSPEDRLSCHRGSELCLNLYTLKYMLFISRVYPSCSCLFLLFVHHVYCLCCWWRFSVIQVDGYFILYTLFFVHCVLLFKFCIHYLISLFNMLFIVYPSCLCLCIFIMFIVYLDYPSCYLCVLFGPHVYGFCLLFIHHVCLLFILMFIYHVCFFLVFLNVFFCFVYVYCLSSTSL